MTLALDRHPSQPFGVKFKGTVKAALDALLGLTALVVGGYVTLMLLLMYWPRLSGGTRGNHIREHHHFASQFQVGDTNTPLLAMDWFSGHGVYFCRVSQSGKVYSARDVGYAIQGGGGISSRFSLDSTNRPLLEAAIASLPPSAKHSLPKERQLLVSGICSNQWFDRTYDRASVPPAVERLYALTGAYLGWYIPVVTGRLVAHSDYGNYHTSQAGIDSFLVARDAPIAVSAGVNGIQVWDLARGSVKDVLSLRVLPINPLVSFGYVAAVSFDGRLLAVASGEGAYAMDLKSDKLLWSAGPLQPEHWFKKHVIVGGEKGQYLFVAGAHMLEWWDLRTGQKLAVLASNEMNIELVTTSRNGRVVLAGLNKDNGSSRSAVSFEIWEADQNSPACRFMEPEDCGSGISADGRLISLSPFGRKCLVLYDWRAGQRKEVPLRVPYASGSAYSMYWSPDGTRLAAYVDTYPASIVIYETSMWKPLAQWCCGRIMEHSEFGFDKSGLLLHLRDHDLSGLDVTRLRIQSN